MERFVLTFGSRYATIEHPVLPDAQPDGWYVVIARDLEAARHLACAAIGTAWSDLYPESVHDPSYYPAGQIGTLMIVVTPAGSTEQEKVKVQLHMLREVLRAQVSTDPGHAGFPHHRADEMLRDLLEEVLHGE